MNSKRIRSGLYQVGQYRVEDYFTGEYWTWRVTDTQNYSDPWIGDYVTKREAIDAIKEMAA